MSAIITLLIVLFVFLLPFFLLIKYGNADRFTKCLVVNKNAHDVVQVFNTNIRELSTSVKILLLITNIIYPSDENWAGDIDWHTQTCEIMRIPRWYDVNPFSLKISCEVRQHFQQSVILVKPLFTRKSLFVNSVIVWLLYLLLQSIQNMMGEMFLLDFIDAIQGLLITFFPIAFYIEWRVSLNHLKKLFGDDFVSMQ